MAAEGLGLDLEGGRRREQERDPAAQGIKTVTARRQDFGFTIDPAADGLGPDGGGLPDIAEGDAAADGFGLDGALDVLGPDSSGNGLEADRAARAAEGDPAADGLAIDRFGGPGDPDAAAHLVDVEIAADLLDIDIAADVLHPEGRLVRDGEDIVHADAEIIAAEPPFGIFRLDPQDAAFLDDLDSHQAGVFLGLIPGGRLGNLESVDPDFGLVPTPDLDGSGDVLQRNPAVAIQRFGPVEFLLVRVSCGQTSGEKEDAENGDDDGFVHSDSLHGCSPSSLQRAILPLRGAVDFFFASMMFSRNSTLPLYAPRR